MKQNTKLKVSKSLALEQFVKSLIQKGVCEIKELVQYESKRMDPQLITDVLNFVEEQVTGSKFDKNVSKTEVAKEILKCCFSLNDEEITLLDGMIQHAIDNGLVKNKSVFLSSCTKLVKLLF